MTQELRKLAEAATQGPCIHATDFGQVGDIQADGFTLAQAQQRKPLDHVQRDVDAAYIAAANPAAILTLLDRLEKAEKDVERLLPLLKQALSVVDGSYNENYDESFEGRVSDALRAEIDAMEANK